MLEKDIFLYLVWGSSLGLLSENYFVTLKIM